MYDVNRTSIASKLACIPDLAESLAGASASWYGTLNEGLAQERALHLAAEIVTDVGHSIIDGFVMRDASSYEDIIEIIAEEGVIAKSVAEPLRQLVLLRKSLVQDYNTWPRRKLHPLSSELPELLLNFASQVNAYLAQELDR